MELSEEEKKAIEYLENRLDILHNNTQWATEKSIKVVLNLTEKQQREIKHQRQQRKYWRDIFYEQQKEIKELHKEINQRIKLKLENEKCAEKDFVYKGKIKEKIEELKEIADEDNPDIYIKIDAYQELLEENINE